MKEKSQRDFMRLLYLANKNNSTKIINEYAEAEQQGHVKRRKNKHNLSPTKYAERLLNDGIRKGWVGSDLM